MGKHSVIPFPRRPYPRRKVAKLRFLPPEMRARGMGWGAFTALTAALCTAVFAAILLYDGPLPVRAAGLMTDMGKDPAATTDPYRTHFSVCGFGPRINCVVDGDTIWHQGAKIRIADINTPETGEPACDAEAVLGQRATYRLQELLNAGAFDLEGVGRETDRYGRQLRVITRGGTSLGDTLVTEGLAERWQGYKRSWC